MAQVDLSVLEAVEHPEPKAAPGGPAQEALSITVPQIRVSAVPRPVPQTQRVQARMAGAAAASRSRLLSKRHVNRCGPGQPGQTAGRPISFFKNSSKQWLCIE